jgi:hypothetical protein
MSVALSPSIVRAFQLCSLMALLHFCHSQPYLCEAAYILLEYAKTCMFLWMFIEGLYLHNVVTVTVFQGRFPHLMYAIAGWGSPVLITVSTRLLSKTKFQLFFLGSLGCFHGNFQVRAKMLVRLQPHALLLDSRRTPTRCDSSEFSFSILNIFLHLLAFPTRS